MTGEDILFARLAYNLLDSGDVEEATKILEKGLRSYPSYAQAHYILAKCYMKQHLTDEARVELERVLRYDPNHANAIKDLSSLHFLNGFQDLYKEYLFKLFTLNPLNEEILDEVKKLGEYKIWTATALEPPVVGDQTETYEEPAAVPDKTDEAQTENEAEAISQKAEEDLFPEKVDLSQFDNIQDDFTTILHGSLEHPGIQEPTTEIDFDMLKSKEEIFGEEESGHIEEVKDNQDEQSVSQDDSVGDDEELVIKQINATDEHLQINEEVGKNVPKDLMHLINPTSQSEISENESEEFEEKIKFDSREQEDSANEIEKLLQQQSESAKKIKEDQTEANLPVTDFDHLQDEEEGKFEKPKIISQTLGEILVSQKKYSEAKSVFEALKEKSPSNKSLDIKIAYLNKIIGLEQKSKS
jgi:tetratricopeptide (TPR) repeat protein